MFFQYCLILAFLNFCWNEVGKLTIDRVDAFCTQSSKSKSLPQLTGPHFWRDVTENKTLLSFSSNIGNGPFSKTGWFINI